MISEARGGEGADGVTVLREGQEEKVEGNEIKEKFSDNCGILPQVALCPGEQNLSPTLNMGTLTPKAYS